MLGIVCIFRNHILAVAFLEDIGVGFIVATVQSIVSGSAVQNVAAFATVQNIVAVAAV